MSDITLYGVDRSSHCRSVLLLARHIGLPISLMIVDPRKGDNKTPEYLAINPEHLIPTMVDHEYQLMLGESRAIVAYLADQYAPGNPIYPKDPVARARVNKWLFFDNATLISGLRPAYRPISHGTGKPTKEALDLLHSRLQLFDKLLAHQGTRYAAGDHLTIADLCLCTSLDMPSYVLGIDISPYPHVDQWYLRVKKEATGYDELCADVLHQLQQTIKKRDHGSVS